MFQYSHCLLTGVLVNIVMLMNCMFAQTNMLQSCVEFLKSCHLVMTEVDSIADIKKKLCVDYIFKVPKHGHHHISKPRLQLSFFGGRWNLIPTYRRLTHVFWVVTMCLWRITTDNLVDNGITILFISRQKFLTHLPSAMLHFLYQQVWDSSRTHFPIPKYFMDNVMESLS